MRSAPLLIAGLLATVVCGPAAAQAPPRLLPHRAVYDLSLAASRGARTVESARGRIVFEFTGDACEGYALKFRQVTVLQSAESGEKTSDIRTANFESGDGTSFRFKNETDQGGQKQVVDGEATSRGDKGALSVRLKAPKREQHAFDGGAVFPNTQMRDLITAARAGKTTVSERIYDGSDDGQKVYETLAIIGKRIEGGASDGLEEAARQEGLASLPRWPVRISYFPAGKSDGTPVYTLSFDLYDNGVSRALNLDYGDFALKGEMSRLDLLPPSACRR